MAIDRDSRDKEKMNLAMRFATSEFVAGAILDDEGVRGFCIGGATAEQTLMTVRALRQIADQISKPLMQHLGEEHFDELYAKIMGAAEKSIYDEHDTETREG